VRAQRPAGSRTPARLAKIRDSATPLILRQDNRGEDSRLTAAGGWGPRAGIMPASCHPGSLLVRPCRHVPGRRLIPPKIRARLRNLFKSPWRGISAARTGFRAFSAWRANHQQHTKRQRHPAHDAPIATPEKYGCLGLAGTERLGKPHVLANRIWPAGGWVVSAKRLVDPGVHLAVDSSYFAVLVPVIREHGPLWCVGKQFGLGPDRGRQPAHRPSGLITTVVHLARQRRAGLKTVPSG